MYVFLREPEDDIVESYFSKKENINHLVNLLNNLDIIAFLSEVLHYYAYTSDNLREAITAKDPQKREEYVKNYAKKLDKLADEMIGLLEIGNLKALAKANHEALIEARTSKPRVGIWQLLKSMKDPKVQLTMGFLVLLLQKIADVIEDRTGK